jgi:hypothetical protein
MTDPNLTHQPGTLDPRVELPKDPPAAMGHDADTAGEFADAVAAHREAVEKATEDVGARAPGDHASKDSKSKKEK